ncbi:hypothetical protein VTN77DRAFT_2099 [Rasamsonia byssochlamydoides]|uniref:uncharacterized protein n=1 Tax=Rasamsonia byssochlamydoides TaxID=89139 RepID=UPI003742CEC3
MQPGPSRNCDPIPIKNFSRPFGSQPDVAASSASLISSPVYEIQSISSANDRASTPTTAATAATPILNASMASSPSFDDYLPFFTPAELPVVSETQALSYGQLRELDSVNSYERHRGSTPSFVPNQFDTVTFEPPNGGFQAWAQVLCGFLIAMNTQGLILAFGVFESYYHKKFLGKQTYFKVAWIGSVQLFAMFIVRAFSASLIQKHFRGCFTGGSALLLLSLVFTSFCTKWWLLFCIQGVSMGVAMGLVYNSGVIVLTSYFSTGLGLATTICSVGSSFGGIIFSLIAAECLRVVGFGWTIRIMALINLVTMIPVNLAIRPRTSRVTPFMSTIKWTSLSNCPFILMAIGMFFAFWGLYFGFYFIVPFGKDVVHMSSTRSASLLVVMNIYNLMGRAIGNLLSGCSFGPMNTLTGACFIVAAAIFMEITTNTEGATYSLACLYGFVAAAIQSLHVGAIFNFCGTDRTKIQTKMGFTFTLISIAALTGAPLAGYLIDLNHGKYFYAQLFSGMCLIMSAILLLSARLGKKRCANRA